MNTAVNDVPLPLAGMAALVTGGGSGIGLAAARLLLQDGATVTIAGRSEDRLRTAASDLEQEAPPNTSVGWVTCDVAEEDQVVSAVRAAREPLGRLHIVVASAGTGWVAPVLATPVEVWDSVMATNLRGTFLTIKHGGAELSRSGGGSIIAVSSLAGSVTHRFMSAYCASKAGLDMLVRVAADELGAAGVRVNSVQPSLVDTDLVEVLMSDQRIVDDYLSQMPVSRVGQVDDVAKVIRFLAGSDSDWITGVNLSVDGGHHLRRGPDYEPLVRAMYGDDLVEGNPGPTAT
ncbi:MAG: SDR family oxidoreductase [Acidimicrobiales bacterium]|nr:SDR family oxidoreductase [Acidimicrobiales bacterium]